MLILEYHPDGICVADTKTMEAAESLVEKANDIDQMFEVKFAQAMILDAVRVLMKRSIIDHTSVQFKFNDNLMYCDKNGTLSDWPSGFCDHTEDYLMELAGWNV